MNDQVTPQEAEVLAKAVEVLMAGTLELCRLYGVESAIEAINGYAEVWPILADQTLAEMRAEAEQAGKE